MSVDTSAVDISSAISSVLSQYLTVLERYQQLVTGDPATLRTAAQQCATQESSLSSVRGALGQQAGTLGTDWDGAAYTAFTGATGDVTDELDALTTALSGEGQRLDGAASALGQAATELGEVITSFEQGASVLVAEAADAAGGEVGAFFAAAQQLGDSAVTAAQGIAAQLDQTLAELFGLSGADAEGGNSEGGESESAESGEAEDPELLDLVNPEQLAAAQALAGQPWAQRLYQKLTGGSLDPESLSIGSLSQLNSAMAPETGDGDEDTSLGGKLLGASDIKLFQLPGTDADRTLFDSSTSTTTDSGPTDLFGLGTGDQRTDLDVGNRLTYDGEASLEGGNLKLQGDLRDTFASGTATDTANFGGIDANATNQVWSGANLNGYATTQNGQLQIGGDLRLAAVGAMGTGSVNAGPVGLQGSYDGYVGADLGGSVSAGANGFGVHGDAFAGGAVTAKESVDVAGVGVGAQESLQYGVGAQLDANATWQNGDVAIGFKAGAAVGVGASVGANIDVNLPKIGSELEQYGGAAATAVENSATAAATAAGSWLGW